MASLPRLVVLGTGWGGYSVLKNINKRLYKVIVVSPRNHFLFTPLLCSTTVGTLEFRSIIEPVRNVGFDKAGDFHLAWAESVDLDKKSLVCRSTVAPEKIYSLDYDKLVVAVGALPNTFNVPGVNEYSLFLKELSDARNIRQRLLTNFERSLIPNTDQKEKERLRHIVIVGGGPTGVEFGAELYDFCRKDIARLFKDIHVPVRVTLIESNKILSSFDERLQSFAEKKLAQRENFTLVKSHVTEIKKDRVIVKDGSVLPCGLVVWSTGLGPRQFTANLNVEKTKYGQIVTDSRLNIVSDVNRMDSFAIGDCANIRDMPLPATAQVAERQGLYLAKKLNQLAKEKTVTNDVSPFTFKSMGMLAYIGGYQGLSDLPGFKIKGFGSWFLWRSAYLTRLGSWRLRMQVPLDWLKTLIFGRDTSRF